MYKTKLLQKITKQPYLGLKPKIDDPRNFKVGFLWFGGEYKPKSGKKILELPFAAKNQAYNTCGWYASAGAKEFDEKVELDARTLVMLAMREGKISGDGFSSLKDNEWVLNKFGIAESGILDRDYINWKNFSDSKLLTAKAIENAGMHKTDSYWEIDRVDQIYKAIDDGRPVKIGIDWRSKMNMHNGFDYPWILNFNTGYVVGGHAMYIYGYDNNFSNKYELFKIRNSFGAWWGDNGDCYITKQDLQNQINRYGSFVNLDIKSDAGKILMEYDGKNIKGKSPTVYFVQKGKLKAYPDEITYLAFNVKDKFIQDWHPVEEHIIREIEKGDNMDIKKSLYWDYLKNIEGNDARMKKLIEIMTKN